MAGYSSRAAALAAFIVKPSQASPRTSLSFSGLLLKVLGPRSLLAEKLAKLDGIEEAYLFGSWARRHEGDLGGHTEEDIDVVVIGEPDVDAVYEAASKVGRLLGKMSTP